MRSGGLEAGGAHRVWLMPDPYRLGEQALAGLDGVSVDVRFLDIPATGSPADTVAAARAAEAAGLGALAFVGRAEPQGLAIRLAPPGAQGRARVLVHLLPGHFAPFAVEEWRVVEGGERLPLAAGMLALDGERTSACDGDGWEVELSPAGPLVIDPTVVLRAWVADGFALREGAG